MRDERKIVSRQLDEVEKMLKELRIQYEQYFAGVEKIAPIKAKDDLERQLRLLGRRKIVQTDLRYRLKNLSSRFHSYKGMWERIQRQMDEGRYPRHTQKISSVTPQHGKKSSSATGSDPQKLYKDYLRLCMECQVPASIDGINTMETFLRTKEESIRQRYGNVQCSFDVVNENGKPKIKAKLRR
ncbi:MAG: MXAN_5187 C-terminal domain-containing protein [Desulfuromonadaceae bacterium]